jgi:hypothetical protein
MMSALPFSTSELGERLAASACRRLGIQIFFGQDPDEFVALQQAHALTGYRQLPFIAKARNAANGPFFWTLLRRGHQVLGQSAAVLVPRSRTEGAPLADELARGLLYAPSSTWIERKGWLPGAGPKLTSMGKTLYCGGAWLHADLRGCNMAGIISRLASLYALEQEPSIEAFWVLEEDALVQKGALLGPNGLGFPHSERVFDGYLEITGRPVVMHAVWAFREEYLALLARDDQAYRKGREPDWFSPEKPSFQR